MSYEDGKDGDFKEGKSGDDWTEIAFNRLEIGDIIGGGGVGIVCKGYFDDEPVAIKTLFDPKVDSRLKQEFMDELRIMSRLEHPHIIKFIGACVSPPNLCFVMELCDESVYDIFHGSNRRQMPLKEKLNMALDVASAINYLHNQRPAIIHRDIKTRNLLIDSNGQVKLCDFGLVTTRNTTAGTPLYMAPELLQNRSFNKSVDTYAFGIVLWEFCTEAVPYTGYDVMEIRDKVIDGDRPPLNGTDFTPTLRALVQDCWAQDPQDRPSSFGDIISDLNIAIGEIPDYSNMEKLDGDFGGDCLDALMRK